MNGHAPQYANYRCECGWKPKLSGLDSLESWIAAFERHAARSRPLAGIYGNLGT